MINFLCDFGFFKNKLCNDFLIKKKKKLIWALVKGSLSSLSDNEIEHLDENVFYESVQTCCVLDTDEDKNEDEVAAHIAEIESYLDSIDLSEVCADCRTNSTSSLKKPSRQHSIKSLEWDTEGN